MSNTSLRKIKELSRNMLLFTIGSFGSKLLSFLLVPLYTMMLSTEEYGMVDLLTTTVALLIPILTIDIQDAVLRYVMDGYENAKILSIGIVVGIVGAIVLLVIITPLLMLNFILIDIKYIIFLISTYIIGSFYNIFSLYLKGNEKISVYTISSILTTLVTCCSNIVCLLFLKLGIDGYLISMLLGQIISFLYQIIYGGVLKEIWLSVCSFDIKLFKDMVRYSVPLMINSLSWWINNVSDRIMISFFKGVAENGIYAISYKIPTIISIVQSVFFNAWIISAIKEFDPEDKDGFIGGTYDFYSFALSIVCSVVLMLNIPIASLLYSNDFFIAWKCVPFLLIGTIFYGLSLFHGAIFTAQKNTKAISRTTLYGALINALLNVLLINFYGAVGAASATMIGCFFVWWFRSNEIKKSIQMRFDWWRQYIVLIMLFFQALLAVFIQNLYCQIICVCFLIFLQKRNIKRLALIVSKYVC